MKDIWKFATENKLMVGIGFGAFLFLILGIAIGR
jgi:hypothetical protein